MKQIVQGCMALLVAVTAVSQTRQLPAASAGSVETRSLSSYGRLPLSFEPNRGQTSSEAQWVARGPEYALFLSGHDAVLELNSIARAKGITGRPRVSSAALRMNLLGAQAAKATQGEEPQAGTANYFTGNDPSKWQREVPTFGKVRLRQVYPGIDLVYYGRQGQLEYDFVVAPGADPAQITLQFDGAKAELGARGDLVLPVSGSEKQIRFDKPTVYQMKGGARQTVAGAFHVANDGRVSFDLGSYDRTRELVIDPTLTFEGEIGTGNQQTIPTGIAIDATGAMYLTGYTNDLTFPVTTGAYQTNCQVPTSNGEGAGRCGASSAPSAFVTKLSADGTALVYSTYLHGGGGYEQGQSIAVDALGDAYVLGSTSSNDFPVTVNAYQTYCQPTHPFLGFNYPNYGPTVSSQCDNFYDGGGTEYTVNGPNLFISKLNPTGTALLYSTFFGGSQAAYPVGLALDGANNMYFMSNVIGLTADNLYVNNQNSSQVQFPVTASAYQGAGINVNEIAVSELSADGQTLLYSTFLGAISGGTGENVNGQAFAIGPNGIAYAGGYTAASNFPTSSGSIKPTCTLNANNSSFCQTNLGFVAAIDTTKSGAASLEYASYLGGETAQGSNIPEQEIYGLAADANNNLFVTGYTSAVNFPTTTGAFQTTCPVLGNIGSCPSTAYLSKINPSGSALTWSTFVGGTSTSPAPTYGNAIAFDSKGQVYLYGFSQDGGGDFPQLDPLQPYTGGNKVFVTTFTPDGTTLLFGTRFGGVSPGGSSASPIANGIAVDATGNMYIAGYSGDDGTFGTTAGTYSTPATAGFPRAFFAKFSPITPQSTTTLTIAPAATSIGQNITFTVAVAGVGQTTPAPSGTVTLMNTAVTPAVTIGTITLDATGAGSFSTSTLAMGSYTVVAMYSGDSNYEFSQSAAQPLTVTTQLTANLLENPGAELGTLEYWTIGGPGTPRVDAGTFDAGINPHTGSYDFVGYSGASDSLSQTVSIIQQGITAQQVDAATVLAQVGFWEQGLNQGSTSDNGSITLTFLDTNSTAISTVNSGTIDSHNLTWANGTGAYPIPAGTRSITYTMNFVRHDGSDLDAFIDDNSLTLAVTNYAGLPVTTTTLTSAPSAPSVGQAVTFSAAVAGLAQATPVPTGTVTLMNTAVSPATTLGTITPGTNGTGTFSTSTLRAGSYSVTAVYSGDANYAASTSAVDTFTVSPPVQAATTTTLTVSPTSGAQGTVFTLTATVVDGSGNPLTGGMVNFLDGTRLLASSQLVSATGTLTGTATYETRSFTIGSHALMAKFTGTEFYKPTSTAAAVTITVTGKYATTTVLTASGAQGSYSLAATVAGFGPGSPSGNVVFTDASTSGTLGTVAVSGVVQNFVPSGPISAGSSASQVVSADVNGDGKLDLVVANGSGTMVTVLLGNGDGTYTALPSFGTNYDGITGVAVADFNGDGKLDIATANQSTVGIFLGNGDGTFGAETDFANTNVSAGVFAGDFNGDGKLDLAVPDRYNGMTILIGNGDGTFTQPNPAFNAGASPNYHSAVADFNGDGFLDIAAGNFFNNTVSVLLGNGDGTFQAPVTYATGAAPTATFAGDFNGDGVPDIFLTNASGASISVLLGNGDGTFQGQQTYAVGSSPNGAAVGDLNADGKLDIAVANQNDGTVSVLYGNGDGSFQAQQVLASGAGTTDVSIADVNGDGVVDLESANASSNTVTVFLNQATAAVSLTGVTLPGYGSDNVAATYSGDTSFLGSVSSALALPSNQIVTPTITWAMPAAITTAVPLSATQLDATATDANGNAIPGTYAYTPAAGTYLAAGTQTLSVTFTPTNGAAFTTATMTVSIVVTQAAQPAVTTTTTLAVTSGGSAVTTVASGSVVTLTAAVTAGAAAVSPGQVAFCDAAALLCTGTHLIGTAQVASTGAGAGTATYRFVPGIGAHSYLAQFLGTNAATGSASGPATLAVTGKSPTITTIAQSGSPGNYTLTATTAGESLHPSQIATQTVTINLGQSAQNYVVTGTGPSTYQGSTYGNYYNTQGACVTSGLITTCDLTGNFTSSTSIFAAGTYDFQTVFSGSLSSAILSQTGSPVGTNEPNGFSYQAFAPSTTMTLSLNVTGGGSYAIPVVANGNYAPSLDGIGFTDTSSVCGGTPLGSDPCQEDYVGTIPGATFSGTVTGAVQFELPSPPAVGPAGPTGSIVFEDTSNANASLATAVLGASTAAFGLAQAPSSPVAAGAGAYGVATGDFNGDGLADVVTENYSAGTVSVLLGKGDGTFQPQVTYVVGRLPERVVVADLNGDGNLDLIVANTGSATIGVLLGNGDGTFQPQVTYPAGSPVGLAVMDINHDGYPDVVAGDYYDTTMSVLLGNGDGTLKAAVTYATGNTPQTVAEGDFNGDGNVDVVVGNMNGGTAGVFLGNGDGTFQPMVTYAVGSRPQGVQTADFNGDGKLDIAVSNSGDNTVSILLGNGNGTFQTQVTYAVGADPVGLVVADFNGDGYLDLSVGNTAQSALTQSVLLGNGDGTFQPQLTFSTGNFPYGEAVADFNGDGLPDMAVANFNDGTATILLSQVTQTATASAAGVSPTGAGNHAVVASYPGDANFGASLSSPTNLAGSTVPIAPTLTWAIPGNIVYGTPLSATQLDAVATDANGATLPGVFAYTPAAGTVLAAGTQTLSASFTPTSTSYSTATITVPITVTQAVPTLTWAPPAPIITGNALSSAQLDATAAGISGALPGTFVYTPAAGTVLAAGITTLSVTFTPTDAVDYTIATTTVPISVSANGCAVPGLASSTMNLAYFTLAETDKDANYFPINSTSTNYVLPGLGKNGFPVYNTNATASSGSIATPNDLLSDNEITWWSPALNNGGPGATSDVVATGTAVVSLPFSNDSFYPPNGAGPNDANGFQTAVLTGTLFASAPETVSFSVSSDDGAYVYLDGQIACDDGGDHGATSVPCTTPTIAVGNHTLQIFYADLTPSGAALDFSVTTSNVGVTSSQFSFGATSLSPAQTEPLGTAQAITISNPVTYSGLQPTGPVAFALNGVSYPATCSTASQPTGQETCTAVVPAATVAALPAGAYPVTGSFAGDCTYAAATAAPLVLTITGGAAPTLASVSPAGTVAGGAATTVTLTGANFTATDVVEVNTTLLATTFVNATTLTAVVPANLLTAAGTVQLAVVDTATKDTSGALNFVVAVAPVVVFTGPSMAGSDQQQIVTFQLQQPYAVPINCLLTLTFAPATATGIDDPAVQFSTGGRTISFTVPAGSTTTPAVEFQTGTVAGTVTVTLGIVANDLNVTPANVAPVVVVLPAVVPQVVTATVTRAAAALTVTVTGFSNTRELQSAIFHFTPTPGNTIADPDVTIDATGIFATWFSDAASDAYGSSFTYTQPFNLSADPSTIQSVTVTLVNGVGSSVPQTSE